MMKPTLRQLTVRSVLPGFLFLGILLQPVVHANVTARYGTAPQSSINYITQLPIGSRLVYLNQKRYYLANGVYYQAAMLNGRTVFVAVDTTWQR